MTEGALAHLRVLDMTDLRGALAGRLLADLGADTEVVLREWLALAPSRITELIESGVCR
jgi:crotonobetainyl-CoA:carnitine CoA-transferase CaiB-like acyl-CoA transferase